MKKTIAVPLVATLVSLGALASGTPVGAYENYVRITDDSEALAVEVPAEWSAVDGSPMEDDDGGSWPRLIASTDLESFGNDYGTPGVVFLAQDAADADDLLDDYGPSECASRGRSDYDDGVYQGKSELFSDCPGAPEAVISLVAAQPDSGEHSVVVGVQIPSDDDQAALRRILDTFEVVGDVQG